MADRARATVSVSGVVQGVFFRADTMRMAVSLGLAGWVRNMPDGTVQAAFEGERADVERAVEWCGRGPSGARVESLSVIREEPAGGSGFEVRYD